MRTQKGATFTTWVATAGILVFIFITLVKLMPVYLEFYAARSLVDKIATEPSIERATTQQLRRKVEDYLTVNSLYSISADDFSILPIEGRDGERSLAINYEVRKHWIANIDFLTTFNYAVELGKAGDS